MQNIYVVLEKGVRYRIETAQQLIANATTTGIYEITADLDFTDLSWPNAFTQNAFEGKMYSTEGHTFKIKNATATYASTSTEIKAGGLFGSLAKGAEIKDLSFENAVFDLAAMGNRNHNTTFGLFAGNIETDATMSNVSVGGTFRIGRIIPGDNYSFNRWANGDTTGLTKNEVKLQIYGELNVAMNQYYFDVDPESVEVDVDGNVTFTATGSTNRWQEQESYDIEITEAE